MALRTFQWLVAGAMTMAATGCPATSPSVPLADFHREHGEAVCAQLYGCCNPTELGPIMALFGEDEAACRRTFAATSTARVEAGAQTYDAAEGARCIDQLNAYTCETFSQAFANRTLDLSCDSAFRGLLPTGTTCVEEGDCVAESFCEGVGGSTICAPRIADGEGCVGGGMAGCRVGSACRDSVCWRQLPVGAACTEMLECASTRCTDGQCAPVPAMCVGT